MDKPGSWRKADKERLPQAEAFLKEREQYCVAACSRYLRRGGRDHLWYLPDREGRIRNLLFHSRRSLFPILLDSEMIPPPPFMGRFLRSYPIHLIQGLSADVRIFEHFMDCEAYKPSDAFDYYLMKLDVPPAAETLLKGPPGISFRIPEPGDTDGLFPLQEAYEKEEVLPRGAIFNPVSSRLSLEHIIRNERSLIAELDGRIVGKINTNARSFSRCQIGGVYVLPPYRGRGIGTCMTARFADMLIKEGWGLSLFVKQRNTAASALYRRLGFSLAGDYRIVYY
ncbi:GNAT family N-acetyltransferase [Treponema sp. OttesenSCG-928-L16]|nr:GNAT family N-acetyltransferase [Treponema sp. OttesenSCG-928-L16]